MLDYVKRKTCRLRYFFSFLSFAFFSIFFNSFWVVGVEKFFTVTEFVGNLGGKFTRKSSGVYSVNELPTIPIVQKKSESLSRKKPSIFLRRNSQLHY